VSVAGPLDEDNANAFSAWKKMGSPLNPNVTQYAALEKASAMQPQPITLTSEARDTVTTSITVPRQGVALVVLNAR
jgi:xylan 1,4-beta-xylosidase